MNDNIEKLDPINSINAIFPTAISVGEGVEVLPLSLAHYALLEKISSYLVSFSGTNPDPIDVLRTYYICTHDSKEILRNFDKLDDLVMEWGDKLTPSITGRISEAIKKQIEVMSQVTPAGGNEKKV